VIVSTNNMKLPFEAYRLFVHVRDRFALHGDAVTVILNTDSLWEMVVDLELNVSA